MIFCFCSLSAAFHRSASRASATESQRPTCWGRNKKSSAGSHLRARVSVSIVRSVQLRSPRSIAMKGPTNFPSYTTSPAISRWIMTKQKADYMCALMAQSKSSRRSSNSITASRSLRHRLIGMRLRRIRVSVQVTFATQKRPVARVTPVVAHAHLGQPVGVRAAAARGTHGTVKLTLCRSLNRQRNDR